MAVGVNLLELFDGDFRVDGRGVEFLVPEQLLDEADVHGVQALPAMEQRGYAFFFIVDEREYRVGGLEKTIGTDALKITLRLRVLGQGYALFHLDQIDLCRDAERRRFMDRAAEETGLTVDLLKRDLGKLLLAVEQTQSELAKPMEEAARTVTLSPEEREAALAWLKAPNLIDRLRQAFHQAGIIGEEFNTLVAYLAGVSRIFGEVGAHPLDVHLPDVHDAAPAHGSARLARSRPGAGSGPPARAGARSRFSASPPPRCR
jgi:hypothetical protein